MSGRNRLHWAALSYDTELFLQKTFRAQVAEIGMPEPQRVVQITFSQDEILR